MSSDHDGRVVVTRGRGGDGSADDSAGDAGTPADRTALACLTAGIEAVRPAAVVEESVAVEDETLRIGDARYDLSSYEEVIVVGGGKATAGIASALGSQLGDRIDAGAVVVDTPADGGPIERYRGGHPMPTEASVAGAARVLDLVESADEDTLVLAVVTGGASALLAAPAEPVGLDALRETTAALLGAGADIDAINAVRKHLSRIKGGRLAEAAAPATVVGLLFSDVVGNDPGVVGSGPTAADETSFADALAVLDRFDFGPPDVPAAVRDHLERGVRGEFAETPNPDSPKVARVQNHVLADGRTALDAAAATARDRGYETLVLSSRLRGEARECGVTHAAIAEEIATAGDPVAPPAVVLSGGETTVTVRGDGTGGPNLESGLAAGIEFADPRSPLRDRDCAFLAADTDGRDGSTEYAGALVDPSTVSDRDAARRALAENDAAGFLGDTGALLTTGSTGTNVNDLRVVVVEA